MSCPFCVGENIRDRMIYKDDLVMSFPSNTPIVPGHVLVCPVRHTNIVDELTNDEVIAIKDCIVRLKQALRHALNAQGFNVAWNEGEIAGQSVNHLHVHVVPRKEGDAGIHEYEPRKFLYRPGSRNTSSEKELQEIVEHIKRNLA